ncbi:MAG: hypothetical protein AAFX57_03270 [Bacteroidota bacterium]
MKPAFNNQLLDSYEKAQQSAKELVNEFQKNLDAINSEFQSRLKKAMEETPESLIISAEY